MITEESWYLIGRYYLTKDSQYHIRIAYGRGSGYTWAVYKVSDNSGNSGNNLIHCGENAHDNLRDCAHEARCWVLKNICDDLEKEKNFDNETWTPLHWGK